MTGSPGGAARSSDDTGRWCQVTGKTMHATLGDANAALARRRSMEDGDGLHAYHCAHCGWHHLGHGGRRGRHFDADRRRGGPRLSGTARLRRKLGEAMVRGDKGRAAAIARLILRFDQQRRG